MGSEGGFSSPAAEAENARTGNEESRDGVTPRRELWKNRAAAGRRVRAIEAMVGGENVQVEDDVGARGRYPDMLHFFPCHSLGSRGVKAQVSEPLSSTGKEEPGKEQCVLRGILMGWLYSLVWFYKHWNAEPNSNPIEAISCPPILACIESLACRLSNPRFRCMSRPSRVFLISDEPGSEAAPTPIIQAFPTRISE